MDVSLYTVGQKFPTASAKKNQSADAAPNTAKASGLAGGDASLRLAHLHEAAAAAPAIDEQKVARVSDAVQSGRYTVDPYRVAVKLLAMERRMPG
jgi:flagellar biosynthesis anti-sigma factor FlgM